MITKYRPICNSTKITKKKIILLKSNYALSIMVRTKANSARTGANFRGCDRDCHLKRRNTKCEVVCIRDRGFVVRLGCAFRLLAIRNISRQSLAKSESWTAKSQYKISKIVLSDIEEGVSKRRTSEFKNSPTLLKV